MSAQETTPGHSISTAALIASIISIPWIPKFPSPLSSVSKPGGSSSKTDPSQPYKMNPIVKTYGIGKGSK